MSDARGYWDARGRDAAGDELAAVCYAGAPRFVNEFAAWSQRRAVAGLLAQVGDLRGLRALDVGCGTGRWSRELSARGAVVVGVDRSASMLDAARGRSPSVEFREMSVTDLELADGEFDLALAVTVLQHLPPADQERAIAELARVVRPGGHVLTIDREGGSTEHSRRWHTFPRPRAEWVAAWAAAGLTPVAVRGQEFSYPLRLASLGRRARPPAEQGDTPARRGGAGWRRAVLRGLVLASYATDAAVSTVAPRAPAEHVAALYRAEAA